MSFKEDVTFEKITSTPNINYEVTLGGIRIGIFRNKEEAEESAKCNSNVKVAEYDSTMDIIESHWWNNRITLEQFVSYRDRYIQKKYPLAVDLDTKSIIIDLDGYVNGVYKGTNTRVKISPYGTKFEFYSDGRIVGCFPSGYFNTSTTGLF
jgi:hypothetical protein